MPALACLQRAKDNALAKGMTMREYADNFARIKAAANAGYVRHKNELGINGRRAITYSMDNPKVHKNAKLGRISRHELPPNSPDMHKVVEHAHARLKQLFKKAWRSFKGKLTAKNAWALLEQCAVQTCRARTIGADCGTLAATYRRIIELEGDWPEKCYR